MDLTYVMFKKCGIDECLSVVGVNAIIYVIIYITKISKFAVFMFKCPSGPQSTPPLDAKSSPKSSYQYIKAKYIVSNLALKTSL